MGKPFGDQLVDKFKSKSENEEFKLGLINFLTIDQNDYNEFGANFFNYKVRLNHWSVDKVKGQGEVHNFELLVYSGSRKTRQIISHEALNLTGKEGLINSIKRMCHELVDEHIKYSIGG